MWMTVSTLQRILSQAEVNRKAVPTLGKLWDTTEYTSGWQRRGAFTHKLEVTPVSQSGMR